MTTVGQLCLLIAFVAAGYAAFACAIGAWAGHRSVRRSGLAAAAVALAALTGVAAILVWALLTPDFRFAYVVEYADALLPWQYRLSACWVGQAGSLLLWAWFLAALAIVFRFWPAREASPLRESAFSVLLAYLWLLLTVMVFAADPMQPSLVAATAGRGLAPSLQHPAMLIHPPIVFLGYAAWGLPFALALAALLHGRLDPGWLREARGWSVFAWVVLGAGILIGGLWAYEELGWGGYWSWDPIENGSLMPWLTGTALLHCMMAWKYTGTLKKTTLALAVATFGLCNFATFLTRSGIFSSLHAFSQSPIGWIFLVGMFVPAAAGYLLIVRHRAELAPARAIGSVCSREAGVLLATVALVLLTVVLFVGTLAVPLSTYVSGTSVTVGSAFYNNVLIPTGLLLLLLIGALPLVRWGAAPPAATQKLLLAAAALAVAVGVALACGVRHPLALAVAALVGPALATPVAALLADARRWQSDALWRRPLRVLAANRRQYAGFAIHIGVAALAVGISGSSLASRSRDVTLHRGESIAWAGHTIRYAELVSRDLPDQLVVEAELEITPDGGAAYTLRPAQHLYRSHNQWSSEVAIHSSWRGDFYTILHSGKGRDQVSLTLIDNPLMRWLWLAGWIGAAGALVALLPSRRHTAASPGAATLQKPHWLSRARVERAAHD